MTIGILDERKERIFKMEFEKLKNRVNDSFLDKNLKCRKKIEEDTLEEHMEVYLPLGCIDRLHLSEEEEIFIIDYLGSLGIPVLGRTSCYSDICDNYTQALHLRRKQANLLTEEEQKNCLEEYQKTKDINLRNRLVESNLPLVNYLSRKYSYIYGVEEEVLESYGAEGLILAIDTYDPTRGKFSAYLSLKIKALILQATAISFLGEDGITYLNGASKKKDANTKYFQYFYTKAEIEKQTGIRLKDSPELIEKIALALENSGYCRGKYLEELKTRVSFANPYSYEQMEEDLCYFDDDNLYGETVEKVFQQELTEYIEDITEELSEKNRDVVRSYYGLGGRESNSLKGIGKVEGVTHETIRLRCKRGKESLKNKMNSWCWQRSSITESFLEYSNHEYENNVHNAYLKRK